MHDEGNMANVLNNIGDAYMNLGDYSKSLEYLNKALKLNEKNDDKFNRLYI